MAKGNAGDNIQDPMRGRQKAERGGADNPGYANKPTKSSDEDANYSRPETGPDSRHWLYKNDDAKEDY